jgi:hypothetical protein
LPNILGIKLIKFLRGLKMTKAQSLAYKFRHIILVAGILFTLAGIAWAFAPLFGQAGLFGTPFIFIDVLDNKGFYYCIATAIFI